MAYLLKNLDGPAGESDQWMKFPGRITYVEHIEGNSTSKRCLRSDRECISARDRTISREGDAPLRKTDMNQIITISKCIF